MQRGYFSLGNFKTLPRDLADALNVKKRNAMQKESARLAAQWLERVNKK